MKKRLTKVLALGLTAAMLAGAPLSAMATEAMPADAAVTNEAVTEEDAQTVTEENADDADATVDVAETQEVQSEAVTENPDDTQSEAQAEIEMQAADDGIAVTALTNGVDPMTLNGLIQLSDGNWYYMEGAELSFNAHQTVQPACGSWWYVDGWRVNFSFKGFGKSGNDLWYVENGQVQFGYTGIATGTNQYGYTSTYYVSNGRVDTSFHGLCYSIVDGQEGWYNISEGKLCYNEKLVEYNGVWWYINGDHVDFSYTGAARNEAGTWYVRNGQVDFGYTGMIEGKEGSTPYQYYFVNGKTNDSLTGVFYTTVNGVEGWYGFYKGILATSDAFGRIYYYLPGRVLSNAGGWWYINPRNGMVDFSYTGLGITEDDYWYHYWYVENGQINFNYNGQYDFHDRIDGVWRTCYITNGQVPSNFNGVYQLTVNGQSDWYGIRWGMQAIDEVLMNPYDGSWWYSGDDGVIDFSYTGIAARREGSGEDIDYWYVRDGQIDFSSNGFVKINNYYVYVQNGKVQYDMNGLVQATIDGKDGWWNVEHGRIFYNSSYYYTLSYYGGSWWAVYDSQVDFSYTGLVKNEDTVWYVENGRVNFDKTGFINTEEADSYAYIQNGQYNEKFSGLVYAELDGKTSWWRVEDGKCKHSDNVTWNGKPQHVAANESGLWTTFNGEVVFDVTGEYERVVSYAVTNTDSIFVKYMYQVENGRVTSMQITFSDYPY